MPPATATNIYITYMTKDDDSEKKNPSFVRHDVLMSLILRMMDEDQKPKYTFMLSEHCTDFLCFFPVS